MLAEALGHYPPDVVAAGVEQLISEGRTCTRGQLDIAMSASRRTDGPTPTPPPMRERLADMPPPDPARDAAGRAKVRQELARRQTRSREAS